MTQAELKTFVDGLPEGTVIRLDGEAMNYADRTRRYRITVVRSEFGEPFRILTNTRGGGQFKLWGAQGDVKVVSGGSGKPRTQVRYATLTVEA